jgi:hypothetical protein
MKSWFDTPTWVFVDHWRDLDLAAADYSSTKQLCGNTDVIGIGDDHVFRP